MLSYEAEVNEDTIRKTLDRIEKTLTFSKQPSLKPVGILCGGQPGAGKSTFHRMAKSVDPNIVIINGDSFRGRHPNNDAIHSRYGDDSVIHTQPFVNAVVEGLIDRLSAKGYSLLVEGTLRDPNVPLETCRLLKSRGYEVELHVMAVSKTESWWGTITRYEDMKAKGMPARRTPREKHDEIAASLPGNLEALYNSKLFDRIALFKRDASCIYDSKVTPGTNPRSLLNDAINSRPSLREYKEAIDKARDAKEGGQPGARQGGKRKDEPER